MKKLTEVMSILLLCCVLTGCACEQKAVCLKGKQMTHANPKPFNNTKIVQIGIVVRDVEKAAQAYADFFGAAKPEESLMPITLSKSSAIPSPVHHLKCVPAHWGMLYWQYLLFGPYAPNFPTQT